MATKLAVIALFLIVGAILDFHRAYDKKMDALLEQLKNLENIKDINITLKDKAGVIREQLTKD